MNPVSTEHTVIVEKVTKKFGRHPILSQCSFRIKNQESAVLIGRSGGGKSVLLRCILGLMTPDKGTIRMGNYVVGRQTARQTEQRLAQCGVVFQSYALFDSLNVWENITFGLPGKACQRRAQAQDLLAQVQLDPSVADQMIHEISGGMKRRVSIARAIAKKPRILFFDEPTEGLDPPLSAAISTLIRRVIDQLQATALTVTHNMHNAHVIGDRVMLLDQGTIAWQGPAQTLAQEDHPLVREFVQSQSL